MMFLVYISGKPLGPTGSFIGGTITLILCIHSIAGVLSPSWRAKQRWGKIGFRGPPISRVGCAAWAIAEAAWSVCLFAHAFQFQSIDRNPLPIVLTAFFVVVLAAIGDSIYFRGRRSHTTHGYR